jgi:hypothetical protein
VFHGIANDNVYAQATLDHGHFVGMNLVLTDPLIFKKENTKIIECIIHLKGPIINSAWYRCEVGTVHGRVVDSDIYFGDDLWRYDGDGTPHHVKL